MLAHKNNPFTAIIVGGNAAGLSAASKLKRLRPSAKVLVFEKTPQVSYSSCGIPYWIEGTVASEQQLIQLSAEDLRQKRHIEVFTHHEVLSIDRRKKQITVRHLTTARELTLGYDKLLLATGARPIVPPWPGNHADNIFTLRSLQDAQHFQQALNADIRRAVVIGAGYVGLEMAAALRKKNYAVTLIEKAPRLLPQYDPTISEKVHQKLKARGIEVYTGVEAVEFETNSATRAIALLTTGAPARIHGDIFLVAVGIQPEVSLARDCGLALGTTGAIATDDFLRTSDPNIFAAGDCIELTHQLTGEKKWLPLGPAANKQGRVAGENMAGGAQKYWGALGTVAFTVFDLEVARTGLNVTEARAHFGQVKTTRVQGKDIAGYLPGEKSVSVVLLYQPRTGRLLGAELAGYHGIAKRVDVLATALAAKFNVMDLRKLDLSYAPPVAPVWDPILVAANVASRGFD